MTQSSLVHASWARGLICALSLAIAACSPESNDGARVLRADSAGVSIVTSTAPGSGVADWSVGPAPRVQIGGTGDNTTDDNADSTELLYRVTSATMLDDGGILLSNSGTTELRRYAADGTRVLSFGEQGQGPGEFGEFSSMRIISRIGDSVAVDDAANGRVNVFGIDGHFGRTFVPSSPDGHGRPALSGALSDGYLALAPVGSGRLAGNVGDFIDMAFAFLHFDRAAKTVRPIGQVKGRQRRVNSLGEGAIHYPFVPLTVDPSYATSGSLLVYNESGTAELRLLSDTGELTAIYRWAPERVPYSEIRERFRREFLAEVNEERRPAYERLLASPGLPVPDVVPAVQGVLIDGGGYMWAEKYRLPWDADRVWYVLDPSGEWLGEMQTPSGVTVHEIGRDYILGVHRDPQGVESVVVYDLDRG